MKKTLLLLTALLTLGTTICYGTLSATYAPVSYTGNGATEFAFPYSFFEKSDLIVYRVDADGVQTVLVEGSGTGKYTIFAANNDYSSGATVTTGSTYTDGQITIERSVPYGQELSIGGDFVPAKPLEQQLDKLAAQTQQTKDEIGRTITIPVTDSASLTTVLPAAAERASKLLACDSLGNIIAQSAVDSGTIVAGDGIDVSVANVIAVDFDGTTITTNASAEIEVPDGGIDSDQIADDAITTDKIPNASILQQKMIPLAGRVILGNAGATPNVPTSLVFSDDETLGSDSADDLVSERAIKAYVDGASSFTTNGYHISASGLIIQWGNFESTAASGTTTFPTNFPTDCLTVVGQNEESAGGTGRFAPHTFTTNQFSWGNTANTTDNHWMAIGY